MSFKPGDRVRFLNQTGGGIVSRVLNSFMVSVAIEDGFEIPIMVSELVLVEQREDQGRMFNREETVTTATIPAEIPQPNGGFERLSPILNKGLAASVPSGFYLAYVPVKQDQLLISNIDIYLINHSPSDILFSLFLKEDTGKYSGFDYGSVEKSSKILIESVIREDINLWINGILQILVHSDEVVIPLAPLNISFKIKGSSLFNENSFREFPLLGNQKAISYTIAEYNRIPDTFRQMQMEKGDSAPAIPDSVKRFIPESIIDQHRTEPREAEVDLHISALRDKFDNLTPHEILSIQTGYFERTLESALANSYRKVVYIHGVGNGTLKQAIVNLLGNYENIEFRNAPFVKYGTGAIEIILH